MGKTPYVVLCSGQSNMARAHPDMPWNPPAGLQVWRYTSQIHGSAAGDGFAPAAPDTANYATFYGAELARLNPQLDVYVINISSGGTNLCQWLERAEAINMWQAISNNVSTALACIPGKTYVDEIVWWGHESDAHVKADMSATQFRDDFLSVIEQLDAERWVIRGHTPIRLHRLHPKCNGLAEQINFGLELLVLQHPDRICLSDTTHLNYSDNIHLDADQKKRAARHVLTSSAVEPASLQRKVQQNWLHNGDFTLNRRRYRGQSLKNGRVGHDRWHACQPDTAYEVIGKTVQLKPAAGLAQRVRLSRLSGSVITLSMEAVTQDLQVSMGEQQATVTAGPGRRQASFQLRRLHPKKSFRGRLQRLCGGTKLISIRTVDGAAGSFSSVKLEPGGGYTGSE